MVSEEYVYISVCVGAVGGGGYAEWETRSRGEGIYSSVQDGKQLSFNVKISEPPPIPMIWWTKRDIYFYFTAIVFILYYTI